MARKIVSDEAIADGMIARLTEEKLYEKWIRFAASREKEEIKNASDYIINCEEDISEWLLSLIPYMEKSLRQHRMKTAFGFVRHLLAYFPSSCTETP